MEMGSGGRRFCVFAMYTFVNFRGNFASYCDDTGRESTREQHSYP